MYVIRSSNIDCLYVYIYIRKGVVGLSEGGWLVGQIYDKGNWSIQQRGSY